MMRDLDAYYILDGRKVCKVSRDAAYDWLWADQKRKIIAREMVVEYEVSTIFMIHDYGLTDDGPPVVFETMVFGKNHDGSIDMTGEYTDRCSEYDDAVRMHKRVCDELRSGVQPCDLSYSRDEQDGPSQ